MTYRDPLAVMLALCSAPVPNTTHKPLIVQGPDPALKTPCTEATDPQEVVNICHLLRMALLESVFNGVGLAAPQIGHLKRIALICPGNGDGFCIINPVYIDKSDKMSSDREGCLSYPGVHPRILRHRSIRIRYMDEAFQTVTRKFSGFDARIIQHEMDHLDGECKVEPAFIASRFPAGNKIAPPALSTPTPHWLKGVTSIDYIASAALLKSSKSDTFRRQPERPKYKTRKRR